ncbi:MAG: hypothetical protein V4587_08365, partial [Acidobacteriota bacterium]
AYDITSDVKRAHEILRKPEIEKAASDEPVRKYAMHLVVEPGGFVGFMRELSQPALTLTPPPPPTEPPDMEFIMSAAARYGIEILGPPGIPEEKA